jgi:hypothetical protein
MRVRTKQRSFLNEIATGFIVSLIAAAVALTASFAFPAAFVARLVVAGLGLALVLRAIGQSDERTGRIVTVGVWLAAAAVAWISGIGLPAYVALHAVLVWLVRALFSYSRFSEAGLDLGLTAIAVSFGVWAAVRTESVFLATWCFLLVHALSVAIPGLAAGSRARRPGEVPGLRLDGALTGADDNRGFADALKAAEAALERIAARR